MRPFLLATLPFVLHAQEIMTARAAPADYRAHVSLNAEYTLAADFLGRTVPAPNAAFVLKDYIVVEAGLFTGATEFHSNRYSLRLNGKTPLLAQTPGMVGASLKYPSWEGSRRVVASAGVGDAAVILGRDTTPRFPGDRRAPTPPPGTPVKTEIDFEVRAWDWVERLAWQDGAVKGPAAGLLYFPYAGNLGKLKTVDLIYNGPEGSAILALRASTASPAKSTEPARKP